MRKLGTRSAECGVKKNPATAGFVRHKFPPDTLEAADKTSEAPVFQGCLKRQPKHYDEFRFA
jgi:hypothetical protein